MRQGFKFAATMSIILLLAGCDSFNHYSISEDAINQSLNNRQQIERNLGIAGLFQVTFTLEQLKSRISRDKLGFVTLNGKGKINLTTLLGKQALDFKLTVSAQPSFNKQQSAIFLQNFNLTEFKVTPNKLSPVMNKLDLLINRALSDYFAQHPAYTLSSKHGLKEAVIKPFVRDLDVQPGAIVIKLGF